ncbi:MULTISPECIES: ABC transporter substrate-binding protein [Paenibacillus]|uniref:ABC transporter substrate-binding protein n=1 Tax=Paenibacillus TaxID=44249 RepID=UPI000E232F53|nr:MULTISPECIES: ABC transporter substrate-binding protein [Paenibacillus]MCM2998967.1 ABC transporter substrate-binding protein [Paenibacillus cellulositrophicus]RED39839.1 carbohydrate ABC transporter substrate-binding protein (CUT1 family) [Paenibacillus sp. VMFN-D1]
MVKGKKKWLLGSTALFCALTVAIAGCSSGSGGTKTAEPGTDTTTTTTTGNTGSSGEGTAKTKTTISITYRDDGIGEKGTFYKWLKELSESYPNKDVEIKPTPIQASEGDYFAKVALALKSKDTAPDIVTEDTFILNSDASAGYLEPLDDKVKAWEDWTNGSFIEAMKKGVTASDGKVYGVPYNTDSRGLWYNKEIFKQAGLPEDWQPKTWDDVLNAARTIKEKTKDVVPIWMNMGKATGEATSMQTYEMLLYGTGERLYDNDTSKWIIKSQGIIDALTFIQTVNKEKLGPPLSKVLNGQAGNTASREYLPKGKLAISLDGSWITGNYFDTGAAPWPEYKDVLGFAPMPTSKGQDPGSITLAGGWALSIPSNAQHKDEAWDFIKYALNKDNTKKLVIASGNITVRADVAKDPEYTAQPFNGIATEYLQHAEFRPAQDKYPEVSTQIQTMVESVATGTSPADAAKKYAQDVTRIVGEDHIVEK